MYQFIEYDLECSTQNDLRDRISWLKAPQYNLEGNVKKIKGTDSSIRVTLKYVVELGGQYKNYRNVSPQECPMQVEEVVIRIRLRKFDVAR